MAKSVISALLETSELKLARSVDLEFRSAQPSAHFSLVKLVGSATGIEQLSQP
jgi:hypothetical protein